MNWRRGFIRAWAIGSLCWTAYWIWRSDLPSPWCEVTADNPYLCAPLTTYGYFNLAFRVVGVPILVLLLGFGISWVLSGFRPRKISN